MSVSVGIVGASGYVGGELIRWVLQHPALRLEAAVSRSRAGERIDSVWPVLSGFTDGVMEAVDVARLAKLDVVFLATPHGAAVALADALDAAHAPVIVDCSRDHRHAPGWVYGQPEWHEEALIGATRIAAPGCFATAIALALAPLAHAGVIQGTATVCAATGSAGSGASPKAATHHPERFVNLKAYKVLQHQHVPEVRSFLSGLGQDVDLAFVPLSAPVDRGILATCFATVDPSIDVDALFADAYAHRPLIRIRSGSPELRHVRGTAFCDLSVYRQGDTVAVLSAIDILGRGASAQALQALDVALGLTDSPLHRPAFVP